MTTITIPTPFEGPPGTGQGGYTAARVVEHIGGAATVAFRSPIPLDEELTLEQLDAEHWQLSNPSGDAVLDITRWTPNWATTTAVSIADARAARERFEYTPENHPAHHCFSCGAQPESMQVHAGPLGDGRYATDWTIPHWAANDGGTVDQAVAWAAVDCTAGWYIAGPADRRAGFTVQLAVEVLKPLVAGDTYAVVGWEGDYPAAWDGRKRGACSSLFDATGDLVARSRSFWVAFPTG